MDAEAPETSNWQLPKVFVSNPKYTLAKLHSKYMIIEVLSFAQYREELKDVLHGTSKVFRKLLIENFQYIRNVTLIEKRSSFDSLRGLQFKPAVWKTVT